MAEIFSTFWNDVIVYWVWPLAMFLIGLGAVVLVHEFGHFIMAKRAGIRVTRFALGFFHPILSYRKGIGVRVGSTEPEYQQRAAEKLVADGVNVGAMLEKERTLKMYQAAEELGLGETEYRLNWLPIGGYVHMSGQDDFAPDKSLETTDPRGYGAATVGKRFGVIAAGVVMNLIFAAVLFPIIGLIGMDFNAPMVGETVPTFPASRAEIAWTGESPPPIPSDRSPTGAGLRPGDRVKRIEGGGIFARLMGEDVTRFQDLMLSAVMAEEGDVLTMQIEREVAGKTYPGTAMIGVREDPSQDIPVFGIAPAGSNVIGPSLGTEAGATFQMDDRITHVAGQPVANQPQIERATETLDGRPVEVRYVRQGKELTATVQPFMRSSLGVYYLADGSALRAWKRRENRGEDPIVYRGPDGTEHEVKPGEAAFEDNAGNVTVLPLSQVVGGGEQTMVDLLGMVPRLRVQRVYEDSAAAEVGLQPGDIILSYGDRPLPTLTEQLETSNKIAGSQTRITVLRADGSTKTLTLTPREQDGQYLVGIAPGMDQQHAVVASVRPGSLAAEAGIEPGTDILTVGETPVETWVDVHHALQAHAEAAPDQPVTLKVQLGDIQRDVELGPFGETQQLNLAAVQYDPFMYTNFGIEQIEINYSNPLRAIGWGFRETSRWMVSVYGQLAAMIRGSVGVKSVGGPLRIGATAVTVARQSVMKLVYFMALLSVLLAVFNFLPLPVLDGGHAVLLLIEKIRGRPLPARLVIGIQMVGLFLIFGLMIVIFIKDVVDIFG